MEKGAQKIGTGCVSGRPDSQNMVSLSDREYDLLVEAGRLIPAEEFLRMSFPQSLFVDDDAEYFRWYEYGGVRRLRPLDFDELASYLMVHRGYASMQEAQEDVHRYSGARRGDQALWKRLATLNIPCVRCP